MTLHERKDGDWRGLWQEYGPKLLLFARQQSPLLSDAEDIVQEAFVRYWKLHEQDPELLPALLFTLVKRIAIDHARQIAARQSRETQAAASAAAPEGWFEDPVEDRERKAIIESRLRALPAAQREVVVLKIWGGLTFEQIGKTLDISPHTAASRYRYALDRLEGSLSPLLI